jgi:hypothetical protein
VTEPYPESYEPQLDQEPRDPAREAAYENNLFGLALFGAFLLLFAGSFAVAIVYLALD